jgi:hypothetical protein
MSVQEAIMAKTLKVLGDAQEIEYSYDAETGDLTLVLHTRKFPSRTTKSGKNLMLATTGPHEVIPEIKGSKLQMNLYAPLPK